MRFIKRLDLRHLSVAIHRLGGGQTLGTGWLFGDHLFVGFVRIGRRMRPVRMKDGRKA
jgi:hypothetical protein